MLALGASSAGAAGGGIGIGGGGGGGGGGRDQTVAGAGATPDRYQEIWSRVSKKNKHWASTVATCESGKDPDAIGGDGLYRGAFQFMRETWRSAPRSPGGDPIDHSYKVQAVVAVALKRHQGTSPWPVCG